MVPLTYKAFGLVIASEIELDTLPVYEGGEAVDLVIRYGQVPNDIEDVRLEGENFRCNAQAFLFHVPALASFYVTKGREIVVEKAGRVDAGLMTAYLLGICVGMALQQRGILAFHGSALVIDHQAVIITGDCGAGKSTLSQGFRQAGYGYLSDDLSVALFHHGGQVCVSWSFPGQRLHEDSATALGYDLGHLKPTGDDVGKYHVGDADLFLKEVIPLGAMVKIVPFDGEGVVVEALHGMAKMPLVLENLYTHLFIEGMGLGGDFFEKASQVMASVKVFKLYRPKGAFTVTEQMNQLLMALKDE